MPGTAINECPVSYISPRSSELVQIYLRADRTEIPMFGEDLSQWPIWAVDMKAAIEVEKVRVDNARHFAENRD